LKSHGVQNEHRRSIALFGVVIVSGMAIVVGTNGPTALRN